MPIDRLTAEDRLMLEADQLWPQDVGAIAILDGSTLFDLDGNFRIDLVREAIGARVALVPRFSKVIYIPPRGQGGPLWVDDRQFDVRRHVGVVRLPLGSGDRDLLRAVEALRRKRLDRSKPLWEAWLLPGLADGKVGLYMRFHHALADGRAAMTMLAAFVTATPAEAMKVIESRPALPMPTQDELVADNVVRHARGLVGALSVFVRPRLLIAETRATINITREMLGEKPVPKTSLDQLVGSGRSLALVRTTLAQTKVIGHEHGATANDVLVAVTAGGLRAVLLGRGEAADNLTLRAYVPVSLRRGVKGMAQGNLISQMVVHLPIAEPDPSLRIGRIAAETGQRKAVIRPSMGALFRVRLVRRLALRSLRRQRVNSIVTLIHGPRRPLFLAGAQLLEMFPLLNLFGNETLGVGALTYGKELNIGIIADRRTFQDLDVFVTGLQADLDVLAESPTALRAPEGAVGAV